MKCHDCPELGMIDERTVTPRAVCCLRTPAEPFTAESAAETAERIARDTGGRNRQQRRAEKARGR